MEKIRIGLYGDNGHQLGGKLANTENARAEIVALANCKALPQWPRATCYDSLPAMLADKRIQLVSLCSPRRADQAADAVACLAAGKHVYAEKPCAMNETDLNRILAAARDNGRQFHEMAGTAFAQPYLAMRETVAAGTLGEVVQVFAQKSYPPDTEHRPQDEAVDGGLIPQCGVHAVRMIEHVTGLRVEIVNAMQTRLSNPERDNGGDLRIAAVLSMGLDNGAVASATLNYLNPLRGFGGWGNEHLRIFGTRGFVESVDAGRRTRLVVGDTDHGQLDCSAVGLDYFACYIDTLLGIGAMPLPLEEELHPTRVVIRARAAVLDIL